MTGVYRIVNKVNGKCYVGMSQVSIEGRVYSHFNGRGSKLLESAIRKYGSDSFDVGVLEECPPEQVKERERFWIERYDCIAPKGYNLTSGGEGLEGWYFSEEVRKEMSERTSLQMTGHVCSEETKKKISEKRTGCKNSPESIERMKVAAKKRFTPEVRKKISDANKNPSEETRRRMSESQKKRYETLDNPFKGCHHTGETRKYLSEKASERTGDKNSFYGKHHSDETRRVLSEEASKRNKGRHWYTNGEENKFLTEDQAKDFLVDNPNFRPGKTRVSSSTTIESVTEKKSLSE